MTKQRREGEANGPQGQRPARVSRGGPSWTEFVRTAHQAVVGFAGADMINRAEPRACGHAANRDSWTQSQEWKGTQAPRQTRSGTAAEGRGATRLASNRGNPAVRHDKRGWRKRSGWPDDLLPRRSKGQIHWKPLA